MIVEASIVGVFRTVLILIGLYVVLRFLGRLATAKRNQDEINVLEEQKKQFKAEKDSVSKNLGKTKVLNQKSKSNDIEDVDFEEVK